MIGEVDKRGYSLAIVVVSALFAGYYLGHHIGCKDGHDAAVIEVHVLLRNLQEAVKDDATMRKAVADVTDVVDRTMNVMGGRKEDSAEILRRYLDQEKRKEKRE